MPLNTTPLTPHAAHDAGSRRMYLAHDLLAEDCYPALIVREGDASVLVIDRRATRMEVVLYGVDALTEEEANILRAAFGEPPVGQSIDPYWTEDERVRAKIPESLRLPTPGLAPVAAEAAVLRAESRALRAEAAAIRAGGGASSLAPDDVEAGRGEPRPPAVWPDDDAVDEVVEDQAALVVVVAGPRLGDLERGGEAALLHRRRHLAA